MKSSLWIWGLGALIALGFLVPYAVLSDSQGWSGPFLFWLIFGLLVYVILVRAVSRWRV